MSLLIVAAVAIAAVAILLHQNRAQAHERWRRKFEAEQKPQLEMVKLRDDVKLMAQQCDGRLVELEKANRTTQLRKLG